MDELGSGLRLSSKYIKLIKADPHVAHCLKLEYSKWTVFRTALTTARLNSQHRSPDGMSSRLRPSAASIIQRNRMLASEICQEERIEQSSEAKRSLRMKIRISVMIRVLLYHKILYIIDERKYASFSFAVGIFLC